MYLHQTYILEVCGNNKSREKLLINYLNGPIFKLQTKHTHKPTQIHRHSYYFIHLFLIPAPPPPAFPSPITEKNDNLLCRF